MEQKDGRDQNPHAKVSGTAAGHDTKRNLTNQDHEPPREGVGRGGRTAADVKELHSALDFDKETLKKIPIVDAGDRLHQGGTYVDLRSLDDGPFTATSEQRAGNDQLLVRKSDVAYEIWNNLIGEPKPGEDFEESPNYGTR